MENWGKRRLTYEIKKFKKGYYLIYDCCTDSNNFLKKIDGLLRYNEEVLKYMTIKMKKKFESINKGGESSVSADDEAFWKKEGKREEVTG